MESIKNFLENPQKWLDRKEQKTYERKEMIIDIGSEQYELQILVWDISYKKEAKIINLAIHLEKLTAQLSDGLTRTDAEKWLITGLTTTDYKFIDLLISEGVKFTQFNDYDNYEKERLKKLFDDLSVTNSVTCGNCAGLNKDEVQLAVYARNRDAQGFLDQYYPKNGVCLSDSGYNNKGKKRSEITQLDISKKKLIGDLDLSDFVNLRRLACNSNQLTRLFLSQNSNLEEL
ncbi:14953_t:CDS:2 [Funneliformis geosporum]|uniref:14953_t:CDS:1 n=1 Tax=Funneliformis geosporum TaxID=1117311 RepID=A0A9W4SPD4_9GLOM|nr:14953_t:CDS:2 [Funneliformis geosporum]